MTITGSSTGIDVGIQPKNAIRVKEVLQCVSAGPQQWVPGVSNAFLDSSIPEGV